MNVTKHISLADLSDRTGLPLPWLKRAADEGRIPCLVVGRRRMFDPAAVQAALAEMAAQPRPVTDTGDRLSK